MSRSSKVQKVQSLHKSCSSTIPIANCPPKDPVLKKGFARYSPCRIFFTPEPSGGTCTCFVLLTFALSLAC